MSRILAIDHGAKRSGIAVTDPMKLIATALITVETKNIFSFLEDYLKKEKVERFVVGEPFQMDGSPAQSASLVEAFVKELNKKFPAIPVVRQDESFTSRQAVQTMVSSGIGKMKRRDKKLVDKISAVIILQNYLERVK